MNHGDPRLEERALIVVLSGDQSPSAAAQLGADRGESVCLQEVRVNELCHPQLLEELARATTTHRLCASLRKVLREAPAALQPSDTDLMSTCALTTDLLQEVHLCSPNIESGDDM